MSSILDLLHLRYFGYSTGTRQAGSLETGLTLTSVWSRHRGVGVMIFQVTVGPIGRVEMGL